MTTRNGLGTKENSFRIGEEFDDTNLAGAKVKSLITQDGNKWVQVQTPFKNDKVVTTVREFGREQFTATMTVGNVTAVRIFDRL